MAPAQPFGNRLDEFTQLLQSLDELITDEDVKASFKVILSNLYVIQSSRNCTGDWSC